MALRGLSFCFELGTSLSFSKKSEIKKSVQDHGGEVLLLLKRGASYFVAPADYIAKGGFKIDSAKKYGLEIISLEQLEQLIRDRCAEFTPSASFAGADAAGVEFEDAGVRSSGSGASEESETASLAASESPALELALSVQAPIPSITSNIRDSTAIVQPPITPSTPVPIVLAAPPAPVLEDDFLFGETTSAPSVASDGASEGGFDSMDSDAWVVHSDNEAAAPQADGAAGWDADEPAAQDDANAAPASASTALVPVAPPHQTPPEHRVHWDAKTGLGWRRKDVFVRKRELKKIELSLTAEDRRVLDVLAISDFNFPAFIKARVRKVPTGLPGQKSLEEQFDTKKRSLQFENKSVSVINPNASWVDVVKNDPSIRKKIIPPSYVGQKIYVAGINFDDLIFRTQPLAKQQKHREELLAANRKKGLMSKKKMQRALKKDISVWTPEQLASHIKQRKQLVKKIFERFGKIIDVQEQWNDGYLFVTYQHKDDAETAVKTLKNGDSRKAIIREIKEDLVAKGQDKVVAPRHDFYVRWPEYYVKWKAKRREKEKAEKQAKKQAAGKNKGKKQKQKDASESSANVAAAPATAAAPAAAPSS
eukprot:TRINITY_DN15652_c0_g1_i1.p1 TRINITY_DN15652_c0_g1~~TRINITY_DN15652_c0_g1_i1.p1  ORF type:complete len:593 (+),score=211.05 TRINITY_DN15652_c0_g1_i1:257-2035(+)